LEVQWIVADFGVSGGRLGLLPCSIAGICNAGAECDGWLQRCLTILRTDPFDVGGAGALEHIDAFSTCFPPDLGSNARRLRYVSAECPGGAASLQAGARFPGAHGSTFAAGRFAVEVGIAAAHRADYRAIVCAWSTCGKPRWCVYLCRVLVSMNESSRFLSWWMKASLAFVVAAAGLNVVMDPYLLFDSPRIARLNARKPAVETQERMMKAYDVLRADPKTVILGTSRVDYGMDAEQLEWPDEYRPVYNLALRGGGLYTSLRYLQHAAAQNKVSIVLLGLDFEYFLSIAESRPPTDPEFEGRLHIAPDGSINTRSFAQQARDWSRGTFTVQALLDSVATFSANFQRGSFDMVQGNVSELHYLPYTTGGSYPLIAAVDLRTIHDWRGKSSDPRVLLILRKILELCQSSGIRVILFINPVHADELEILDLLGYWEMLEDWKRALAILVEQYSKRGSLSDGTVLWDFMEYNAYTSESVLANQMLRWFWDSRHYRITLGHALVLRMLDLQGDSQLGTLLNSRTIESQLSRVRDRRQVYRQQQSIDVLRVHKLYSEIESRPSSQSH
jgi:hypothetical protein